MATLGLESTVAEVRLLLDGLAKSITGSSDAVQVLSSSAPDLARDVPVCAVFSVAFFAVNWGLRLVLVEPLVASLFGMKPAKVRKFAQSVMEALFYAGFTYIGVFVVPSQPWVWPSDKWWNGFLAGGHEIMRADLRCYYIMYISRYVQMVFSVLIEPKRKDFFEMLLHHFVTVVVTYVSYVYGWNRVGVVTMLLLDPADVPLHLAKVCKYSYEATKRKFWQTLADRLFELFAVAFFVTRLVMYSYVVWSGCIEGTRHIPEPGIQGWTCLVLLSTLLALQLYWFFLIMKVAIRLLKGKSVEDVRSDDETSPRSGDERGKVALPREPKGDGVWRAVYAVLVLAVFARQARVAYSTKGGVESLVTELQVLLGGLTTVIVGGSQAAAKLTYSAPDIPRDSAVFVVFTVVLFTLNWGMRLLLVEPFVRSVLRLRRAQLAKYAQSVMEAVVYGGFMLIGLRVVPSQEWVWPSAKWWIGFSDGGHEVMRSDLRCYYILYISRYFQAVLSVLLEAKRKDFVEMIVHHVVTVVVIYISYVYGWNRVGVVVMVLLDPADVPLHLAKLCKYTFEATKRQAWQFVADRLFEFFAFVFFVTRLVFYGYVCWSCHIEASLYFPKGLPEWSCVALLYTLLFLQVYWFFLIIKVAIKLLRGQGAEDPRSDDEDEDESTSSAQGKSKKEETKKRK